MGVALRERMREASRTMIAITIIAVPYDSGRRGYRMGAGPEALLASGLPETLRTWGHDVAVRWVEDEATGDEDPLASAMELAKGIAAAVRAARAAGRLPLILTGNCGAALGVAAGLDQADLHVLWLDAHGDLNTPWTSSSGFLDGMTTAMLLGWCHREAATAIQGFTPLTAERLMLVGGHDLDPSELEVALRVGLRMLRPPVARDEAAVAEALDAFSRGGVPLYLHIDLDVLDPRELAPANSFAAAGGLTLYQAIRVVQEAAARMDIVAVTLSAYDPSVDPLGLIPRAALPLVSEAITARPLA